MFFWEYMKIYIYIQNSYIQNINFLFCGFNTPTNMWVHNISERVFEYSTKKHIYMYVLYQHNKREKKSLGSVYTSSSATADSFALAPNLHIVQLWNLNHINITYRHTTAQCYIHNIPAFCTKIMPWVNIKFMTLFSVIGAINALKSTHFLNFHIKYKI